MGRFKYLVLIFILIFALFSYADSSTLNLSESTDDLSLNSSEAQSFIFENSSNSSLNDVDVNLTNSSISNLSYNMNNLNMSKKRMIVVLKEKTPLISQSASKSMRVNSLNAVKEKTINDVIIENNITDNLKKLEFRNGFSAELTDDEVSILIASGNVEIREDNPVHAFLQDSVNIIGAKESWNSTLYGNITGKGQTVCIIDTGVDYTHPDLGGCTDYSFSHKTCTKVIGGYDFVNSDSNPMDDHFHGTHVAGIVAANGVIKGVAPDAKIVAVKVLDQDGSGWDSDVLNGIDYCVNHSVEYNISVISMSLGSDASYDDYCDNINGDFLLYADSINAALLKNISVVIATGNDGDSTYISAPACIRNATRVGSTTKSDKISSFSNRNWMVNLFAPGSYINSTIYPGHGYDVLSGTSMATPHVAGAIALFRQYAKINNLNYTPFEIEQQLSNHGKNIIDLSSGLSYSRINISSTLFSLSNQSNNSFSEGNGTLNSPFFIRNCTGLNNIRNNLSAHYSVVSDIDCSNYSFENIFSPIGSKEYPFIGTYNSNNYLISNLLINSSLNYSGLFGYVENSSVTNIGIKNWTVLGQNYSGLIAGYISSSNVSGVMVINSSVNGMNFVGGIFGYSNNSNLTEIGVLENVSGNDFIGGVVGYDNNGIYNSILSFSVVFGNNSVGGIIGHAKNGHYENLLFSSSVIGKNSVGGITGFSNNSLYYTTEMSGIIIGLNSVGGSFGSLMNTTANDVVAVLDISLGANSLGGLVGNSSLGNYSNFENLFGFTLGLSEECLNLLTDPSFGSNLDFNFSSEGNLSSCIAYSGNNSGAIIGVSDSDYFENVSLMLGGVFGNNYLGSFAGNFNNGFLNNSEIFLGSVNGSNSVGGLVGY